MNVDRTRVKDAEASSGAAHDPVAELLSDHVHEDVRARIVKLRENVRRTIRRPGES